MNWYFPCLNISALYLPTGESPRSMLKIERQDNCANEVQIIQTRKQQSAAFLLVFQTWYLRLKAMPKYIFANKTNMDARLRSTKPRWRKVIRNAKPGPLSKRGSNSVQSMWIGILMAAFNMSTTARFANRKLQTVRSDLKRAIRRRIDALERTPTKASVTVTVPKKILAKSGFQ